MKEKINVAELLKDCPKGMELDCTMFDNVKLIGVDEICITPFPIRVSRGDGYTMTLTKYGQYADADFAKCVIFPKGKTTWEGFVPPCKFKDGDILAYSINSTKSTIFIYRYDNPRWNTSYFVALSGFSGNLRTDATGALHSYHPDVRFATEEEKEKLFKEIKKKGYKWNPETKTLEKLLKFKVGDRVKEKNSYISGIITDISDGTYRVEYKSGGVAFANIAFQDDWELVHDKFDITTLKPFKSRVLVRDNSSEKWHPAIWGLKTDDINYPYIVVGGGHYNYCIPFEGNEYLLGSTDDCEEYYKTWKQ